MIRFTLAVSSALLGSLLASPLAIGQEPNQPTPPAREPVVVVDPYMPFYQFFLGGQETQAVANLPDALETNFGLSLSDADDALRAQLEIVPGQGVVVIDIKAGSLAEQAGLKRNDILLSLGDQTATGVENVRKLLLGLGKEALEVKLIREGKARRLSLVGPEHGFAVEVAEYWIGVPVSPVDSTLRTHLPSLPADSGLIVNNVVKDSPAEAVSVRKNDILIRLDGKPLKDSKSLIEQIQASGGKPVPLEILRAGKPVTITITPAKRSITSVVNFTTNALKRSPGRTQTFRVVRPNIAIEVDPKASSDGKVEVKHLLSGQFLRVDPTSTQFPAQPAPRVEKLPAPLAKADFQLQFHANEGLPNARIESQLKEVMAELEKIAKSLEGLKKPVEK